MKITIIIEDLPNGMVKITSTPPAEKLLKAAQKETKDMTPAEGYAMTMFSAVLKASDLQKTVDMKAVEALA